MGLEQAAAVDGATPMQAFRKVIVPLAAPGVFTAAILVFIFAWNDFIFATTLTSTDNARCPPRSRSSRAARSSRPTGAITAASVVVTIPIIIMVLIFQRRIVAGLAGAVKGLRGGARGADHARQVTKRYPDGFEAVRDMHLQVEDGEFVILVGPSGCGKSTALRMIAGLEDITEGELRIGDQVVNQKRPGTATSRWCSRTTRSTRMTVRDNMGFALKLRGADKADIDRKVREAARILDLEQHLDRKPANLSGGQRQRGHGSRDRARSGGLPDGRAALEPRRQAACPDAHRGLADPADARHHHRVRDPRPDRGDDARRPRRGDALGRAAAGRQPDGAYNHPVNTVRGGCIGSPAMNFMPATVEGDTVTLPIGDVRLPQDLRERVGRAEGKTLIAGIRPENFEDAADRRGARARLDVPGQGRSAPVLGSSCMRISP